MSVVEPDDVSPWTRDDWTGTDTLHLDALTSPDPWAPDGSGVFTEVEGIMRFQTVGRAEATDLDVFGPIAELVVRRS